MNQECPRKNYQMRKERTNFNNNRPIKRRYYKDYYHYNENIYIENYSTEDSESEKEKYSTLKKIVCEGVIIQNQGEIKSNEKFFGSNMKTSPSPKLISLPSFV